jgi:hypothetical protein
MGIDTQVLRGLAYAHKAGPFGRTLTLGRQSVVSPKEVRRVLSADYPWDQRDIVSHSY